MTSTHMVTLCPMRMSYLIMASTNTFTLLPPLCDILVTVNVKDKEQNYFISPKALCILHILADFKPIFLKDYFSVDIDDVTFMLH